MSKLTPTDTAHVTALKAMEPQLRVDKLMRNERMYWVTATAGRHTVYACILVSHVNTHLNVYLLEPREDGNMAACQKALREALQDATEAWPKTLDWTVYAHFDNERVALAWQRVAPGVVVTPTYPHGAEKPTGWDLEHPKAADLLKVMEGWP